MPELLVLALVIGAVIVILIVMVVSDYQRQRLKLGSSRYEERIKDLEDRITGLELENMRLLDQLKVQTQFKSGESNKN